MTFERPEALFCFFFSLSGILKPKLKQRQPKHVNKGRNVRSCMTKSGIERIAKLS